MKRELFMLGASADMQAQAQRLQDTNHMYISMKRISRDDGMPALRHADDARDVGQCDADDAIDIG